MQNWSVEHTKFVRHLVLATASNRNLSISYFECTIKEGKPSEIEVSTPPRDLSPLKRSDNLNTWVVYMDSVNPLVNSTGQELS